MKIYNNNNKEELQFFLDTLLRVVDEGGVVVLPNILSINKTGTKFTENGNISYITINEVKEGIETLEDPESIFVSLIIKNDKHSRFFEESESMN